MENRQSIGTSDALKAVITDFLNLVMEAPVAITVFHGPEFIVILANETYLQIVDKKRENFIGKPFLELMPEVRETIGPLLTKVLQTGKPYYGYEFPVTLNRYGKTENTYFNFTCQPILQPNGKSIGIVVMANEVTDLVKAKHALAEREREFRNLIMQSPIAMTIFRGRDYVIEMANQIMFEKIWRRKAEHVIGRKALDVFPELKEQKYPELLMDVYTKGISYSEKESLAYVEGDDGLKKFYLDFEYAPLFEPEGLVSGIMISVYDVTEKVEARKRIEEVASELEVFKFMADNVTDFIGISDLNGKVVYLNKSGMNKVDLKTFENLQLTEIFFEEDRGFIKDEFIPSVTRNGTGEVEIRFRNFTTSEPVWMFSNVILVKNVNGEPVGYATVSKDITTQKGDMAELEKRVRERTSELQEANRKLKRSNEDLQQFAHVASHDLKEPVRKIKTFSYRLQDDYAELLGERGNTYLNKILNSSERVYAMIDGVLKYSSITATDQPDSRIDLNKVVRDIQDDLEMLIEEKKGTIVFKDLASITGAPELIYQMFYNLINNSLKFSRENVPSVITIESTFTDVDGTHAVVITLKDNGIGFDSTYAENIFSPFIRLNSKDKYEGTGLGLSLCKQIVQRHRGTISARSEKNGGSEFTIMLPAN